MKRTVLLLARIKIEWVIAAVPCAFTPRRSALSLIPVAQKMMFFPLARSSAKKIAFEILLREPSSIKLLAFLLVARPHLALHVAAETFDSRRRQDRFGRAADAHVKIDSLSGMAGAMAAAISPSLIMRSDAPARADFSDDLFVPRAIEHHHDHVLHAFFKGARHDDERLVDRALRGATSIACVSACTRITRGP